MSQLWKAGPQGGSLTSLSDYLSMVRLVSEFKAGMRGRAPRVLFSHGDAEVARRWHGRANLMLEGQVRWTNSAGAVTHGDGPAGHFYENLGAVVDLLAGEQGAPITLQRDAPHQGVVEIDGYLAGDPAPTQDRDVFLFPIQCPQPFWRGQARTGLTSPTITFGGNAPITDAVVDLTGGTNTRLTHTASGSYIQIDGALPAGGVRVDIGAGTCVKITGGTDYSNYLTVADPWWIEFDPGGNAVSVSGGGSVSVDGYDKWR